MEQKQNKIHYIAKDDTKKVVKLMVRTSAEGEWPMKFEPRYTAVAKEIPDDLVQRLIDQEVERITNSMKNWREWGGVCRSKEKGVKGL